jgi:predicted TIM-barrel fold metal-dependent hydrolase
MIDCHAHAFPTLGETVSRVAPISVGIARDLRDRMKERVAASPLASALAGRARSALEAAALDVEKVAHLRATSELARRFEPLLVLGALPQLATGVSLEALYASMERHGIERTVVIAAGSTGPNEWLLARAKEANGKIIPVANVPPMREDATEGQWCDALVALADDGARGFKIHLNMDGLGADHRGYRYAFEVAQERGLFVIVHTGCFHTPVYKLDDPADPELFAPLFEDHPDVRVCLAHMNRDEPEKAWDLMKRYEQLWTDTSWQPGDTVKRAVREVGAERVLLGSDWPLLHGELQGNVLRILREAVGEQVAEQIGDASARTFLGE